jgi:hypothetical protein
MLNIVAGDVGYAAAVERVSGPGASPSPSAFMDRSMGSKRPAMRLWFEEPGPLPRK